MIFKKSLTAERPMISGKKIAIFVVAILAFSAVVSDNEKKRERE